MLRLIELSLACWRLSSLLVREDGPFDVFGKLRYTVGVRYNERNIPYGTNFLSDLLTCIWCASIWVSGVVIAINMIKPIKWINRWLAISSVAILADETLSALGKKQV